MAPGAAAVMNARDRGDLSGILGTIGELCAPIDPSHEDALVTAVGNGMNSIVVEKINCCRGNGVSKKQQIRSCNIFASK